MTAPVVVGVEGTPSSHDALVWAALAARARHCPLEIVNAVGVPYADYDVSFDEAVEQHARSLLRTEAERALEAAPGLEVRTEVDRETPARALTARSETAALVVVGSHRMSLAERVLSGSRSYQVAAGSRCPVAVVPALPGPGTSGVVVGVDGSPDGVAAVALAAAEADRTGTDLHVVRAWQEPAVYVSAEYLVGGFDEQLAENERMLIGESVAGLAEKYPDLVVHQHLVREQPATALLAAAADARLLVVGSRGRHGVVRMLLGSVSHTVVIHAPCPVLVVRTS
ncbi:universal stress protein [Actinotalea sp. K2]|uniref:universal stress protein n=1 Tax=Actinotalea sp. K2 TaxID=2939438 RepID=UPI0020175400|nr:universal stress protein [Actinotalea sp. K2]MCL3860941.1 universal stress protein [Actinotalea sp. K2]